MPRVGFEPIIPVSERAKPQFTRPLSSAGGETYIPIFAAPVGSRYRSLMESPVMDNAMLGSANELEAIFSVH
jgi:hypothetical protein